MNEIRVVYDESDDTIRKVLITLEDIVVARVFKARKQGGVDNKAYLQIYGVGNLHAPYARLYAEAILFAANVAESFDDPIAFESRVKAVLTDAVRNKI